MKKYLSIIGLCFCLHLNAQSLNGYLAHIRNNPAKLTAFFSQMPKGSDLHHHYSGSVYAESYISWVINNNYYVNQADLTVLGKAPNKDSVWASFGELAKNGTLDAIKFRLLKKWSVKDYSGVSYPSDKLFFETFGNFNQASKLNVDSGLVEIKKRAKSEHVSYIETMLSSISCNVNTDNLSKLYNGRLQEAQSKRDAAATEELLNKLYADLMGSNILPSAENFCNYTANLHKTLGIDDETFTMRYQTYVVRVMEAADVFKGLILDFEAANRSPLIVGVNIVAPENNDIAMRDYWLHMQMFKFLHKKYPSVKYSMHAGELCLGMVKPEELTWHIASAVYDAGAVRIGHGVDMPYEKNCYALLRYMKARHIPVEINLYSNEFILKIKGDRHPVTLYQEFGVPIVICSDDAGVLRSSLTEQYVLLANRYPGFTYDDIKKAVYNSITYSFIKEPLLKKKLTDDLNRDFGRFEKTILQSGADARAGR